MPSFDHLVMKVREAANGGIGHLSTGEALAAAMVLNRADWLAKMGYTIPAALTETAKTAVEELSLSELSNSNAGIYTHATLVTYGNSPGYRDVSITLDVERSGATTKHRLCLNISGDDSESIARHILDVQRVAWADTGPIDKKPGEQRPKWFS